MNKKIIGILGTGIALISVGCAKTNEVEKQSEENKEILIIDRKNDKVEDILLTYNQDGMKLLKALYPDKTAMELGLRNIGNEIPNLVLKNLEGKEVSLKDFKGKKVIFEIAQDNCDYCKKNSPIVHNAIKDSDIELVSVFLNSTTEGIKAFYNELNIDLKSNILTDTKGKLIDEFNLVKTPTFVFVDESGKISLIKQTNYDEVTIKDDINLAFNSDKIYDMTLNN